MSNQLEQKGDASGELVGGALEGGVGLGVALALARRVGDAPVDELGVAGELGADLAHAVAEADHVVELFLGELTQVLGAPTAELDAALAHHPHGVRVQRLEMASGAAGLDRAAAELLDDRLGDLRAGAVAR